MLRAFLLVLCLGSAWAWAAPDVPSDAALEARLNKLSEHLRCLVCQNQSIAESQAELATDLKRQVREMLQAGKSDDEIADYMVQRYGDFVLYDPPLKLSTMLLWAGPAALLLIALGGFAWTVRQRRRHTVAAALTPQEIATARALLNAQNNSKESGT